MSNITNIYESNIICEIWKSYVEHLGCASIIKCVYIKLEFSPSDCMCYASPNAVATINTLSSLHVFIFLQKGLYLKVLNFCMQPYIDPKNGVGPPPKPPEKNQLDF